MSKSRLTLLCTSILSIFTFSLNAQNWSENFENYPIRDSSYKYGYVWQAATITTGGNAITGRSMLSSPLNNPLSPGILTTGYFAMTGTTYNISLQTKLTNTSSSPLLVVSLVDITGTEVAIINTYIYSGSGLITINFSFTGLNGWYRLRFKITGSGGGSRATIDNITSDIPIVPVSGSSTRLSDIQTTVQITGSDCNSQTVLVRFTNLGPDPAFAYGNMGMASLQSLTGINYSSYSTSPNLRLDPLTNTLYFFETFSTTGLPVNQFLDLTITLNTPNNCNVGLGSTFQWFSQQTDHQAGNNTDYQNASFAILPAGLSTISAVRSNDGIRISWTAYNEINVLQYNIERSDDGQTFHSIGSVNARGNGQSSMNYAFLDPMIKEKKYYRINVVDADGNTKLSNTTLIEAQAEGNTFSIYPNPINKSGQLSILSPVSGNILIELYDPSGKVLTRLQTKLSGQNILKLNLPPNINKGQYWLRMTNNNQLIGMRPLMIMD